MSNVQKVSLKALFIPSSFLLPGSPRGHLRTPGGARYLRYQRKKEGNSLVTRKSHAAFNCLPSDFM
jgi:hypothetical protein